LDENVFEAAAHDIALIGYGKMGKLVEELAPAQGAHVR